MLGEHLRAGRLALPSIAVAVRTSRPGSAAGSAQWGMSLIVLLVSVAAAIFVLAFLSGLTRRGSGKTSIAYPYGPQRALVTPAERSFLGVLEGATGATHRIFGKVRLADVIKVNAGLARSARQAAFNRISNKHLDFVLCDPTDLTVVAAIELDDKSHESASRKQRDSFLDAALGAAGIPVHHFSAKHSYSVNEVRTMLSPMDGVDAIEALPSANAPKGLGEGAYGDRLGRTSRSRP